MSFPAGILYQGAIGEEDFHHAGQVAIGLGPDPVDEAGLAGLGIGGGLGRGVFCECRKATAGADAPHGKQGEKGGFAGHSASFSRGDPKMGAAQTACKEARRLRRKSDH